MSVWVKFLSGGEGDGGRGVVRERERGGGGGLLASVRHTPELPLSVSLSPPPP